MAPANVDSDVAAALAELERRRLVVPVSGG